MTQPIKMYFPYATFKRYVQTKIIPSDEKTIVKALAEFNERKVGEKFEVLIQPRLLYADVIAWYRLRNALDGKYLGRDVILECKGTELSIADLVREDTTTLVLSLANVSTEDLRIKDHIVASRILATDMLFKFFYDKVYPAVGDVVGQIREIESTVATLTPEARKGLDLKLVGVYSSFGSGIRRVKIYIPDVLEGFMGTMFPHLSKGAVFHLAINYYIGAGYAEPLGLKPHSPEKFETYIDEKIEEYRSQLLAFVSSLTLSLSEEDVQDKILNLVPEKGEISVLELLMSAKREGIPEDVFFSTLSTLLRLRKLVMVGEKVRRTA